MAASTAASKPSRLTIWWSRWWPYLLILVFLFLFPLIVGLTISEPGATPATSNPILGLLQQAETGYAKFWQGMLIEMFILGIFAMSYDLLLGYTGILSFGHAMFFGTGGYVIAILIGKNSDWPITWALMAVLVVAFLQALIFGVLSLRVKGVYLAMVTLAFAEMFFILAEAGDFRAYTGADDGLHGFPIPAYLSATDFRTRFYYIALILFVIVFLAARRLVDSPTGRAMIATRENENRASMIGYNTFWFKLISFIAAGVFAALAGALLAVYNRSVTPSMLSINTTIDALAMTIIGGAGTLVGPIIGAAIVQLLGYWLERWFGSSWTIIYGTIFMLIVIFLPFGIVGTIRARSFKWQAGWQRWKQLLRGGPVEEKPEQTP